MTMLTNKKCWLYYLAISKIETNCESGDCADRIYPVEPEIKNTIETAKYASYRGLLDIDTQELI